MSKKRAVPLWLNSVMKDAPIHNVTYDENGEPVADEVRRAAGNVRMVRFPG